MLPGGRPDRELQPRADVVVGAVLLSGAKTPKLVTREMLKTMKRGDALVDVAIDQGGCFETSHPTTHPPPTEVVDGVVHYRVSNMPGAVPKTLTLAGPNLPCAPPNGVPVRPTGLSYGMFDLM